MKDYVVFFDLDHTILNTSSGKIMGLAAIRHGIIKKRKLIEGTIYGIGNKLGFMEGDLILPKMVRWLKDFPEQYIAEFARQIFNDVMRHTIRKDAIREIEFHKKNNAHTVILSASMNFICKPVMEFLGLDDLICTDLHVINQCYSGNTKGGFCFGPEKLTRTLTFLTNHRYTLNDAFFYTDSYTDLPMLEAVGNPVCVTPDRKLSTLAHQRGWRICDW